MPARSTWKVIKPGEGWVPDSTLPLNCPHCGHEADMPFRIVPGNPVIAATGLHVIFDRPWKMPEYPVFAEQIMCRKCRRVFEREKEEIAANA
jgi:hypothetical protein